MGASDEALSSFETLRANMPEQVKNFAYWWAQEGSWVEEPNERRHGSSGVQFIAATQPGQASLYIKRQINHCYRSLRYPFGRPTVFREQQAIVAFNALGVATPKLLFCGAEKHPDHWRAVLVTEALKGFISLDDWYEKKAPEQASNRPRLISRVAETLSRFHRAGWQHSCCYGKHIFVRDQEGGDEFDVAMLDLEKVRRRWPAYSAATHDLSQLSRHRGQMPDKDWNLLLDAYAQQWPAMSGRLQRLKVPQ